MTPKEMQADAKAKIAEAEGLLKQAAAEQAVAEVAATPLKTRTDPGDGQPSVADINSAAVAAHEAKARPLAGR